MPLSRQELELAYEYALIDVLEHDYQLAVRHPDDALERRRRDTATLAFAYYGGPGEPATRAVVRVEGAPAFSTVMPVDLGSREAAERSAESCEALARFLCEFLEERREEALEDQSSGRLRYGRREEDVS